MANKLYEENDILNIADGIRMLATTEEGKQKKYKVSQMRTAIVNTVWDVANKRYEDGLAGGEIVGKQTAYDEFWDVFQTKGNRTNYIYGFGGYGWADTNFKPKYDIKPTGSATGLFYGSRITDLEAKLEQCGVILDTTNCTGLVNAFREANVFAVPELDCTNFESGNLQGLFRLCKNLVFVRKLKLATSGKHTFTNTFDECTVLSDIEIEGVIGKTVSFRWSPLSVASLKSIITALKQDTAYNYTITFKSSAFSALEAEGETAEYNGTPCTWAELIDNKMWNLTLA